MTEEAETQIIEPKKERAQEHDYLVLSSMGGGAWEELGRVTARTPKQAIEQEVSLLNAPSSDPQQPTREPQQYVAVPVRSWKPIKAGVEQPPPKVVFSDA